MKAAKIIGRCLLILAMFWSCENRTTDLPVLGVKKVSDTGDTLYHTIPSFRLLDQDSSLITEEVVAGKIYVSDFFFTYCPSICPKMSQQMLRLHDHFLEEEQVVLLSHTVDPDYDTVAVLKEYADALGVNSSKWHLLTGDRDHIYELAAEYMVSAAEDPEAPGGFIHSGAFILLDGQRRVRGYYDGTKPEKVDNLLNDIDLLLQSQKSAP
ncbi:MAG: SCO family protein [Bacteroidota bacterium]